MEWISVKDRLPDKETTIIAYDGNDTKEGSFICKYGEYSIRSKTSWRYEKFIGFYDPECGCGRFDDLPLDVLYWMPLPQPPK